MNNVFLTLANFKCINSIYISTGKEKADQGLLDCYWSTEQKGSRHDESIITNNRIDLSICVIEERD